MVSKDVIGTLDHQGLSSLAFHLGSNVKVELTETTVLWIDKEQHSTLSEPGWVESGSRVLPVM